MKYNLINFGYDSWSRYWKRNQTMYHYLYNEAFIQKALFINTSVWIGDFIRNIKQELSEPKINNWRYILPKRIDDKNTVITPVIVPYCNKFNYIQSVQNKYLFNLIDTKGSILMINYPPSRHEHIIDRFWDNALLKIFDWSDDYEQFSTAPDERMLIRQSTEDMIKRSDIVITINEHLADRAIILNKNTYVIRNASNYFMFNGKATKLSINMNRIKKPIIGYVGWLNKLRLNLEIIEYVASKNPDMNFVFIGPKSHEKPLGDVIPTKHNVHILDPVHCSELPAILEYFDVCILPNNINEYTKGNDPLKIYDYLSCGKPIVSTKTSGTEQFSEYLYFADDKYSFNDKIAQALSEDDSNKSEERIELGFQNSWLKRYEAFRNIIIERL